MLKGGSASKVMQNVFLVTFLLLGHFNMMPVIPGLLFSALKKKAHKQKRLHFKRKTNLDWGTFDMLSYKVEQQPMQKKALKNLF